MAVWQYSVGNLARRAPAAPVAVAPAVADALLSLENLADDYPDTQGGLEYRSDGVYDIDFDLNLLATSSARADAPTGWLDLLNYLEGAPGLPANPADWGDYGARTDVLRVFRPTSQDIDVMPGEDIELNVGLYRPSGATGSTGTRVTVLDLFSGKGWNGSAWADGGVLSTQSTSDAWSDVQEEITADPTRTERALYRVIVEPVAASYDATTYAYCSANGGNGSPALIASADFAAIIGHNIPDGATVAAGAISLSPGARAFHATGSAVYTQTWRLSIDVSAPGPRPIIGEVWIGLARSFSRSPELPLRIGETAPGQLRVETERGRVEVVGDEADAAAELRLSFRVPADDYARARDELFRLTRFGAEPMLLIPSSAFEGARFFHGRLGAEVAFSRLTAAEAAEPWRAFSLEFRESPRASR